ncbi:hypothetical protein DR62_06995 [Burkholderia thailandensis]|uniref:Ribosomal protein L15 n=1 Tax=Burkholderia thailandensis TaxID=57975 RepID=A0AAW9CLP7_BURTH|nr:hypothetical protein DR62_06995 [Burkholderia thailandensis]AOI54004.1 hypothetical protein WI24_19080 [Burkholderia thailandensis]AOJ52989.1 hypothetical protein AQ475_18900 [Burkholderia thailandensis]AOJ58943.1 hypothetical protein AQ477_20270 [Burkholderia thailandensis]AVR28896.1 hypothetical protein A8H32_29400 [Burkholderia thailandensis]
MGGRDREIPDGNRRAKDVAHTAGPRARATLTRAEGSAGRHPGGGRIARENGIRTPCVRAARRTRAMT